MKKNTSFTLIELLVVIVIIGVIAGVIMVTVSSSVNNATFARAKAFSSNVQNSMLLNLVSEWTFDEDESPYTTAKDTWGINNGTNHGASYNVGSTGNCVFGGCYTFTSSESDYIDCKNNNSLNVGNLTISVWMKVNSFSSSGRIVDKISRDGGYRFYVTSNEIYFSIHDGTGIKNLLTTDLDLETGTWYYIVVMAGNNMMVYKNGISSINTQSYSGTITNDPSILTIGSDNDGGNNYPFDGLIDDVRIYNTALSSSQIQQNSVAGLTSLLSKGLISREEYNQKIETLGSAF